MITIQWQTRDDTKREVNEEVIQALSEKKTVVFVDDINDSGKTFKEIKKAYQGGKYVALAERHGTVFKSDARSLRLDDQRWIVFPWEKD